MQNAISEKLSSQLINGYKETAAEPPRALPTERNIHQRVVSGRSRSSAMEIKLRNVKRSSLNQ